jgi:hypothetical protein
MTFRSPPPGQFQPKVDLPKLTGTGEQNEGHLITDPLKHPSKSDESGDDSPPLGEECWGMGNDSDSTKIRAPNIETGGSEQQSMFENMDENSEVFKALKGLELKETLVDTCKGILEEIEAMWPSDLQELDKGVVDKEIIWSGTTMLIPIFFVPRVELPIMKQAETSKLKAMITEVKNITTTLFTRGKEAKLTEEPNKSNVPIVVTQLWMSMNIMQVTMAVLAHHERKIVACFRLKESTKNMLATVFVAVPIEKERLIHFANYRNRTFFRDHL